MHFVQAKGILSQNNGMNIYRGCSRLHLLRQSPVVLRLSHTFEDIRVRKCTGAVGTNAALKACECMINSVLCAILVFREKSCD